MRFKGKILNLVREGKMSEMLKPIPKFKFSRKLIHFNSEHDKQYYIDLYLLFFFQDKSNYTFDKEYDKNDKKRFVITFADPKYKAYLQTNLINTIKCNLVHKRYLIQRDPDWFWKTLIAAAIGAIFGFIGSGIGYRKGFQDGIKYTKPQSQDTAQKLPSKTHH